ncbi:MAG: HAMP domain-containing histidine kinase [Deltaproteobacteria bacterium]|nr:HAMP domain-containing histidine kinase [Deltaproteobacteria bacterium]
MNLGTLRSRILISAVGSAVLALVGVYVTMKITEGLFVEELQQWSMPEQALDACEAAPASWAFGVPGRITGFAYDRAGRSLNPDAPPLERGLLDEAEARGAATALKGASRIAVAAQRAQGPCAVIRVELLPPEVGLPGVLMAVGAGTLAAILLAAWVSYHFTIIPLLRRILRIREAAQGVGTPTYLPPDDPLEDALGEIAAVLDRSHARIVDDRDELVRRHQALERHMAEIAHDLRTPLASLVLALEEVAEEVGGAEGRAPVSRAVGDAVYVLDLVENLHQATRLRHGLDPTEGTAELADIVERLGFRFGAIGRHEGVEVAASVPDGPVPVRCSPALAERAIGNLVHNAVIHGQAGGHVAVVLSGGPRFRLEVLDDGEGLREEHLADLSATTFRSDSARTRGGGLGLAITHEVARRVGWTLRFEAVEPRGLRVVIEGEVG